MQVWPILQEIFTNLTQMDKAHGWHDVTGSNPGQARKIVLLIFYSKFPCQWYCLSHKVKMICKCYIIRIFPSLYTLRNTKKSKPVYFSNWWFQYIFFLSSIIVSLVSKLAEITIDGIATSRQSLWQSISK